MKSKTMIKYLSLVVIIGFIASCKVAQIEDRLESKSMPNAYKDSKDTSNLAKIDWKSYFSDANLVALIDTALQSNQELNIAMQEIAISNNEIRARKGEYLPFLNVGGGLGLEKSGKYTRNGAVDEQLEIKEGKAFPTPLTDFMVGGVASWELDIWKKLRTAKKSAMLTYLASVEGRNFLKTKLIADISESYYELLALDNLLSILDQNIEIQSSALRVVKQQKDAASVTLLAVNRFEAQVLNTQNLRYEIKQKITEAENRITYLTGKFPSDIVRNATSFDQIKLDSAQAGIPVQLLTNRPDIRQAEFELMAAKLDVKVARANFYPSARITAGLGFQSFNPIFLFNPSSILYNLAGDITAPLINRNALFANYNTSSAKQIQTVLKYEQTVLNAYVDVLNQLSKIKNYAGSYDTKSREVAILNQTIGIANNLFNSARADYAEVLFTQREALDAKIDLVEIKLKQLNAKVNIYRALGGGWN